MLEIVKTEFEIAKENLIQEILKSDLSEYDKMEMISEYNLYDTESYIQEVFEEDLELYKLQLNIEHPIIDDYFHMNADNYNRGQLIIPYTILDWIEFDEDEEKLITIFTNRRNDDEYKISLEEFERLIYKWHHDYRLIGFHWDW